MMSGLDMCSAGKRPNRIPVNTETPVAKAATRQSNNGMAACAPDRSVSLGMLPGASMLGSAAGFLVLALPLSLPTMYAILIWLGFAMGIASTLTLSGVMHLAPPEVCGTALTLRMTGNRVGQIVFPALAGVLAAATGVAGILLALGLGLAASGIAVAMTQPPS